MGLFDDDQGFVTDILDNGEEFNPANLIKGLELEEFEQEDLYEICSIVKIKKTKEKENNYDE